jgi:hypothetical protein
VKNKPIEIAGSDGQNAKLLAAHEISVVVGKNVACRTKQDQVFMSAAPSSRSLAPAFSGVSFQNPADIVMIADFEEYQFVLRLFYTEEQS